MKPIEEHLDDLIPLHLLSAGLVSGHIAMRITQSGWALDIESKRNPATGLLTTFLVHTYKVAPHEEEIGEPFPIGNFVDAVKYAERKLDELVASNPLDPFGNPRKVTHTVVKPMAA